MFYSPLEQFDLIPLIFFNLEILVFNFFNLQEFFWGFIVSICIAIKFNLFIEFVSPDYATRAFYIFHYEFVFELSLYLGVFD